MQIPPMNVQDIPRSFEFCFATIGVCVFGALTSVGALFYFWAERGVDGALPIKTSALKKYLKEGIIL